MKIICKICREESGGNPLTYSLYGSVHKYGPVDHNFHPLHINNCKTCNKEFENNYGGSKYCSPHCIAEGEEFKYCGCFECIEENKGNTVKRFTK